MCDPTCLTDRANVLRYYGTGLQVAGIVAAALGIRAVRREWTRNPGLVGAAKLAALAASAWTTSAGTKIWRIIRSRILRRPEQISVHAVDSALGLEWSAEARLAFTQPAADADVAETVDWLVQHVNQLLDITQDVSRQVQQERTAREAAIATTTKALAETEGAIRQSIANLAGGGLRLQTWGVLALLIGVVLGTIPERLATLVNTF